VTKTFKEIVFLFSNDFKSIILVLNPINDTLTLDKECDLGILILKAPLLLLIVLILDPKTFKFAKIKWKIVCVQQEHNF